MKEATALADRILQAQQEVRQRSYTWDELRGIAAGMIEAHMRPIQDHNQKIHQALSDLVKDLEQRADMKLGDDRGVVDCGHGVYIRAKSLL